MADVELVIKIHEDIMEYIKNNGCLSVIYNNEIANAVLNGIPLPKGHGDLISRDFMKEMGATCIAKRISTGELVAISSIDELTEELGKIKADKENK